MSKITFPLLTIARHRLGTDGEGVTTLAAGAGCPLHCKWCINKLPLREAPAENVTPEELLDRVKTDHLYFDATDGRITFGGGEALMHADFIRAFREICPAEWRITVETSLFVPRSYIAEVTDAVDLFVVDCKDMNGKIYRKYTGEGVSVMADNLRFLLKRVGPERVIVRVPLIPEYNTAEDQRKSAEKLAKMGVTRLDLFEYVIR